MDHHLDVDEAGNSRNGYGRKTVTTGTGRIELEIPRDRQATFDPQLIAKYQRRFPGFDDKIVSIPHTKFLTLPLSCDRGRLPARSPTPISPADADPGSSPPLPLDHRTALPPIGRSFGKSQPPVFRGAPRKTGGHTNWGIFKRQFWGDSLRHQHWPPSAK